MRELLLRKCRGLARRARHLWRWARHHDAHWFLDPGRRRTRALLLGLPQADSRLVETGNYSLDGRRPLSPESVVYSFGVLTDIDFDLAVADRFGCTVQVFDPTPISIEFMRQFQEDPRVVFHPVGLWIEDTELEFRFPVQGASATCVFDGDTGGGFRAVCRTLTGLMEELGHDHLDVLKMDIEGAALPVLEQLLREGPLPDQVVVELERPRGAADEQEDWFRRVRKILADFTERGYRVWHLPRKGYSYYAAELLFSAPLEERASEE